VSGAIEEEASALASVVDPTRIGITWFEVLVIVVVAILILLYSNFADG